MAELGAACGQALVGGMPALPGSASGLLGRLDAGVVEEAADDHDRGAEVADEPSQGGVLLTARRHEIAVEVGVAESAGVLVEAALIAVDHRKVAADGEPAR